ncbi:MAG: hypothetical protein Q4G07_01055 [Oscillospiraceae bacterium]|nr:hypothetical protein [Oscillospiraceae bacterium]
MCNQKNCECIAWVVSILLAIAAAALGLLGLGPLLLIGMAIALVTALLCLLILTIVLVSPMRQSRLVEGCVCRYAKSLLWSSLLTLAASVLFLMFGATNVIVAGVLGFFGGGLFTLMLFSLGCFMGCLAYCPCNKPCQNEKPGCGNYR